MNISKQERTGPGHHTEPQALVDPPVSVPGSLPSVCHANLATAFPHLTARNLEVGTRNLTAVFLQPLQQRSLPNG